MPAGPLVSSVSTEGVAAADRLAFWEHHNAQALVGLTCSTYEDEGLRARQVNLELDGVRPADIAGNAHVIERAPALVRAQPKDATFLTMLLEGDAFFYSAGGSVTLRAGDLLVYETDRPYLCRVRQRDAPGAGRRAGGAVRRVLRARRPQPAGEGARRRRRPGRPLRPGTAPPPARRGRRPADRLFP
ncbi:MAG TPA: hypothetical protein VGN47_07020 [Blastococcus sp.]|nr:hypothetical protein [Blastococcus sp.]